MTTPDIPPKENFRQQLLASAIVLVIVGIVLAVLAKVVVSVFIFLLAAVFGIGSQVTKNNPLDK